MKPQEISVTCCYKEEGESPEQIIKSSFAAFVQRELNLPQRPEGSPPPR